MQDLDKRDFDARYQDGARARLEVTGGANPLPDLETVSDFMRPFREHMGLLFNEVWNRPGLGRRERALIMVALLAALNRNEELKYYLEIALACGVTRDEIQEVLLQGVHYCGSLAGVQSFRVAERLFAEIDAGAAK